MNPIYTQLQHRLDVYRARLFGCTDMQERIRYEMEIDQMEAELAVMELMAEVDEQTNSKSWELQTDSLDTIESLFKDPNVKVLNLDVKWSWRALNWMYYIKWITIR